MSRRTSVYVVAIVSACLAAGWWVYTQDPSISRDLVRASFTFATLCALSEVLSYEKPGRRERGSIAFLPLLATVVVAPHWLSVVAVGLASVLVQVLQRRVWVK